MAESLNKQRVLDYIRACYAGDIERASSYYDDDIDFIAYLPIDIFPQLGQRLGKAAMTTTLVALHAKYSSAQYVVTSIIAEDDRVAATLDLRLFARDSDRVIRVQIGNFYTLRQGRIRIYRQFTDSFDAVQQKLRRQLIERVRQDADV